MKKALKRIFLVSLAALLLLSFCGCLNMEIDNSSQATPTSIDEVRYNWLILYDKKNAIYNELKSSGYDFKEDALGFNPIDLEMFALGQEMPDISDYITVNALAKLEKRVVAVTDAINELYDKVFPEESSSDV